MYNSSCDAVPWGDLVSKVCLNRDFGVNCYCVLKWSIFISNKKTVLKKAQLCSEKWMYLYLSCFSSQGHTVASAYCGLLGASLEWPQQYNWLASKYSKVSLLNESRFNVKSQFKVQNLVIKMKFHIKKSRFSEKSRFKESKCADGGHSLNRDFTVCSL